MSTNPIKQYGLARIVQLVQPLGEYDGWRVNRRPPQVGDIGTVLDVLHADSLPDKYVVEFSDKDGITIWLDDFYAEELEAIPED